jgi:hypothetical protein
MPFTASTTPEQRLNKPVSEQGADEKPAKVITDIVGAEESSTTESSVSGRKVVLYYVLVLMLLLGALVLNAEKLRLHKVCWTCYLGPLGRPIQAFFKAQIEANVDDGFESVEDMM